eukprot:1187274-Prorocentrum_minimum.AAC.8
MPFAFSPVSGGTVGQCVQFGLKGGSGGLVSGDGERIGVDSTSLGRGAGWWSGEDAEEGLSTDYRLQVRLNVRKGGYRIGRTSTGDKHSGISGARLRVSQTGSGTHRRIHRGPA